MTPICLVVCRNADLAHHDIAHDWSGNDGRCGREFVVDGGEGFEHGEVCVALRGIAAFGPQDASGADCADECDEACGGSACLRTNKSQPDGAIGGENLAVFAAEEATAHSALCVLKYGEDFVFGHCFKVVHIEIALCAVAGFVVAFHVFPACGTWGCDADVAEDVERD